MNEDKEIISQYKQLEDLINTNKDSITKIEVDLKQVAEEIKSSSWENDLKEKRRCKCRLLQVKKVLSFPPSRNYLQGK